MKQIKLVYWINGVRMKRSYPVTEFMEAKARAEALQRSGVSVVVRGMPKRITIH